MTKARLPLPLLAVAVVFAAFGVELWLQPQRWNKTPAYGILLDIFSQQVWGSIYLAVAAIMAVAVWHRHHRPLIVIAHTAAIALTAAWLLAFIIRRVTDPGTTVVNVANWSLHLVLLVSSVIDLDRRPRTTTVDYVPDGPRPPR